MKLLKAFLAGGLLAISGCAVAEADLPEAADWYLHIDFERMRAEQAGGGVYEWLNDEVFEDVRQDTGVDLDKELDSITAFSVAQQGPIVVMRGDISQDTRDKTMALLAADGSLGPRKSSGKKYFRFGDQEDGTDRVVLEQGDNLGMDIALEEGAWISIDLEDTVLITATEEQMTRLLANKGRVAGTRGNSKAILVLTAEKTLLQGGMNSDMLGDSDDNWDSSIFSNTEQVAFLVAAAANKLAFEAQLIASDPDTAESLASVVRGLISLMSFDDSIDAETAAMLRSTRVEADGVNLEISIAVDPQLVVRNLD